MWVGGCVDGRSLSFHLVLGTIYIIMHSIFLSICMQAPWREGGSNRLIHLPLTFYDMREDKCAPNDSFSFYNQYYRSHCIAESERVNEYWPRSRGSTLKVVRQRLNKSCNIIMLSLRESHKGKK